VRRPTIWNTLPQLPQNVQNADTREQFKRRLKNWLFECADRQQTMTERMSYK